MRDSLPLRQHIINKQSLLCRTGQHKFCSILVVALSLCVILIMHGAHLYDLIRYSLYLCVVIFAPGLALMHWATREKISMLRLICVGAGLGYCLEAFVYIGLSSLNLRMLWYIYPVIGIISLFRLVWCFRGTEWHTIIIKQDKPSSIWIKALFIFIVVSSYMTYNAYLGVFTDGRSLIPVAPDLMLHLSTAAEIKHHWPVTDPRLAGFSFSYHYLTHIHIAAASLVTGIALPEVLFRLYFTPLLILVALNTFMLTQLFTRLTVIHLLAVVLVFFSGTVSLASFTINNLQVFLSGGIPLSLGDPWAFIGDGFFSGSSPSLIYGLVLFFPLVCETLKIIDKGFHQRRHFLIYALLIAGSMLAKGSFMPVFVAGLFLSAVWLRLLGRREWINAVKILGISLFLCIPLYLWFFHQYWTGGAPGPILSPFAIVKYTVIWGRFEPVLRSLWASGAALNTVDWTFRGIALFVALVIVAIYFIISYGTRLLGIGYYFHRYGWKTPSNKIVMICLVFGGLVPAYLLSLIDDNQMHFFNSVYPISGIIGALGLGHLIFNKKVKPTRLIWQFAAICMLIVSVWNGVYSMWTLYRIRGVSAALVSSQEVLRLSEVYAAQRWIQNNTSTQSVLAVSLFSEDNPQLYRRCDYSAFAERRMFLEGAHYQRGRNPSELLYRRKLLTRVFQYGDIDALALLRERFQVTHLVVDNSGGNTLKLPDIPLIRLFGNNTVTIYSFGNSNRSS